MKGYTSRDVAKLLGLTVAQVRGFARDGFLTPGRGPRGELQFSFQDLVILRTAKGLVAARIPTRRIRRALRRLRSELPRGRSLAELRITAEDDRIVVSDGESTWSPESDQMQIDFAISDLATRAAPMARRAARAARRTRSTRIARRSPRIRGSPMRITTWRGCTRRRERKRRRCGTSPATGDSPATNNASRRSRWGRRKQCRELLRQLRPDARCFVLEEDERVLPLLPQRAHRFGPVLEILLRLALVAQPHVAE